MPSDQLVQAVWEGPFDMSLPDGSTVRPGDVIYVGAHELESAHLRAYRPPRAKKDETGEGGS